MDYLENIIRNRRLVFSLVTILFVVGVASFSSMARQEDPSFPYRAGVIRVIYPGGAPAQIEQLITKSLEEELAQIDEINKYRSNSRDDIAILNIELKDGVYDTDAAWARVERAIERARNEFPAGVTLIDFDDRQIDLPVAVISVTGSSDLVELGRAAERLKAILLTLPNVSRIETEGDPNEEIVVKIDEAALSQLGLTRGFIAQILLSRNQIVPGGVVQADERTVRINTQSDYRSLESIANTPIPVHGGQSVALSSIAKISLEPREPLSSLRFDDGEPAVSLGVIVTRGQTDVVKFGVILRDKLAEVSADFAPLKINESFFQPDYVSERLNGLQGSLIMSVLIIAGVVFFALGWRTGLLVALVLPVVSLITLGLYNAGGGVFHQIAVVGIVVSLGILIDNAIVVIEHIETSLREGATRGEAIRDAIKAMAKPLLASTGTTIAAFIPLLLAKGGVGDFTRAVPTMIVIALAVSYVISVFVWPLIAFYWLRSRSPEENSQKPGMALAWTSSIARLCGKAVTQAPVKVLLLTLLSVLFSLSLASSLKQQFFPSTDRNQMVIDIHMPLSTPVQVTERISREVSDLVKQRTDVTRVYRAVGASGFRFYYNLGGQPDESHLARITVNTVSGKNNVDVAQWVRKDLARQFPEAVLVARILGQGPPRPAPIEIRVQHPDDEVLFTAAQQVRRLLAEIEGVADLRSDVDLGAPELSLDIKERLAQLEGVTVESIAGTVFSQTRGVSSGQYRYGQDPIPIRVRSVDGERSSIDVIANSMITSADQQGVPLGKVAALGTQLAPTNIRRYNGAKSATVLAEIEKDAAFNQVLTGFFEKLESQPLPADVVLGLGGDAAASEEANSNIATAVPLAFAVLTFFMLYQFNSFRRIGIIFATIPLAAVGVIPGLVLSGQPFGFQSLLGVIALVGIVVNNAIVLVDVIDQRLRANDRIKNAVIQALTQRTSPILLTTATTILGLLPLAFSSSTLWPPMAWAIISGLLLSTILTLFAIPALCVLLLGKYQNETPSIERIPSPKSGLASWVGGVLVLSSLGFFAPSFLANTNIAYAQTPEENRTESREASVRSIDLYTVIDQAASNLMVVNAQSQARSSKAEASAVNRQAWAPSVTLGGAFTHREEVASIDLPTGAIPVGDQDSYAYEFKITQPLFQPDLQRYRTKAASLEADNSAANAARVRNQEIANAISVYAQNLSIQADIKANDALNKALDVRAELIRKRVEVGNALRSDALQIEVQQNRLKQGALALAAQASTAEQNLARVLNLQEARPDSGMPLIFDHNWLSELAWVETDIAHDVCDLRADCQALRLQKKALEAQRNGVLAGSAPKVNLSYADTRSDGQLFVPEQDQRLMLEFSWSIFTGGARSKQSEALAEKIAGLNVQLVNLIAVISIEQQDSMSSKQTLESAVEVARLNKELEAERVRLVRTRYDNGLATLDQLLDAEAGLVLAESEQAKSAYQWVQAWAKNRLATGVGFN